MNNELLLGIQNNNIFIKAIGHITANVCFTLHSNLYSEITELNPDYNIIIDLSETRYMDSTFIGLLIGLEKRVFRNFHKHISIANISAHISKLFTEMSITKFFKPKTISLPSDIEYKHFDEQAKMNELEKLKLLLFTHKNLSEMSEQNKKRFHPLEKHLENEINKLS